MLDISQILDFVKLLNRLQQVRRTIYVTGEDRQENDVEHSYQLAMLAWFIADSNKLNLDKNLLIGYALVHDVIEAYCGDVAVYSKDDELKRQKSQREKEAALKLKKEFPEFGDLHRLIEEYEERKTPEARFVYALDKLQPVLNIYNDNGRTWKEANISLEMIIEAKSDKISLSSEIQKYFSEILAVLEKEKAKLW